LIYFIKTVTIRDFKNISARNNGYEDWNDYYDWCKSNGYDESEIGYDDIAIHFAKWHVEAALEAALNNVKYADGGGSLVYDEDEASIM